MLSNNSKLDILKGVPVLVFFYHCIPVALGMVAVSSAAMVDGIFLGRYVGSAALATASMAFPIVNLCISMGVMVGVGGSVQAGIHIGAGRPDRASQIFSKSMITVTVIAVTLAGLSILFMDKLIPLLGGNASVAPMMKEYLYTFLPFSPVMAVGFCLSYFVRLDNKPMLALGALVSCAGINILLDWVMVGMLGWGIKGAALATGISGFGAVLITLPHVIKYSKLRFSLRQRNWFECVMACYNGSSELVNELSVSFILMLFNQIMMERLGVDGVAAFAVISYIMYVELMLVYGSSDALQPLVSANFGARQSARVSSMVKAALGTSLAIGTFCAALLVLFPEQIASVFVKNDHAIKIAVEFSSVFWPTFLLNGCNIVLAAYFTAMNCPGTSAGIAFGRSLVLPCTFLFTLPGLVGIYGVYLAIPMAEALALTAAVSLFLWRSPVRMIQTVR